MSEQTASRTLLKSPPELWAECSDAQSLTRHLDTFFGEIRITRLEPENTVAWEGERGCGTVRLEPAGWGTRVTLTAGTEAKDEPNSAVRPSLPEQHDVKPPPYTSPRPATFLARLMRRFGAESHAKPRAVGPRPHTPPREESTETPDGATKNVLSAALESLGQAHHRPFSRG